MKNTVKTRELPLQLGTVCLLCMAILISVFAVIGCEKNDKLNLKGEGNTPSETTQSQEIWKCVLAQFDVTVTLTFDSSTSLVSVSKSPEEMVTNDGYHQFRDGNQYFLQNDTLHLITPPPYDSYVYCEHFFDFAITRLSEDTMELEYLGGWWHGANYMTNYLFNKIIE